MRPPFDEERLSSEEDKLLNGVMVELIASFGLGPVKQEVYRRPKSQPIGRRKIWDEYRLFSLWIIVQAWALRGNHKINSACRLLESATGGLTMYTQNGDGILVGSAQIIRKQYYKADAELDRYEIRRKNKKTSDRAQLSSIRDRLQRHAKFLSEYEPLFTSDAGIANRIVAYELAQDEPSDVRYVLVQDQTGYSNEASGPPLHHPDQAELQAKIAHLKDSFGLEAIKTVVDRLPEPKEKGRQKFWYPMRLFTIWFIVQNIANFEDSNIEHTCDRISKMGGVFEFVGDDLKVRNKIVSQRARIRQLYYDAEKEFEIFENTIRSKFNLGENSTLKEQLGNVAKDMANRKIVVFPILSIAVRFVQERLRSEGICQNYSLDTFGATERTADIRQVKFVPDGQGLWRLHPPGIWSA
jgi:hypothetical protein